MPVPVREPSGGRGRSIHPCVSAFPRVDGVPQGFLCENNQLEPDIKVKNDPDILSLGRDQQIEAAVKELLKQ